MFRLKSAGLVPDPVYPADLGALGYVMNERDEVVDKADGRSLYRFKINRNHRFCAVADEAFRTAVRRDIAERLTSLGLARFYLPQRSETRPAGQPGVPILCTPREQLRKKNLVIVVNNADDEDLGVWAWRTVCASATSNGGGVAAGSAVSLVQDIVARCTAGGRHDRTTPGVVVLNPGQPLFSYAKDEALSRRSWDALPRASAMHDSPVAHAENFVRGHETPDDHVLSVFEAVIDNPEFVDPEAHILAIGLRSGGVRLAKHLDRHWVKYAHRLMAIALTQPTEVTPRVEGFARFLEDRGRAWMLSRHPVGTPLANADVNGFAMVSGGEEVQDEAIITRAHASVLTWFEEVYLACTRDNAYQHPRMTIPDAVLADEAEWARQTAQPLWEGDAGWTADEATMAGSVEGDHKEGAEQTVVVGHE